MPRIYDALKAAEQDRGGRAASEIVQVPKGGKGPRAFREKMVGIYQDIEARLPDISSRIVAFVGARSDEGVSVLVREFACVISGELGKRVVLLDGDKGFGGHFEYFGVEARASCKDVVDGVTAFENALEPSGTENLWLGLLTSGNVSLSSFASKTGLEDLMGRLRSEYDLVLIDAPPFADSSDAILIAAKSDGVILVVECEKTRWQVAQSMRDRLSKQNAEVLGVILNKRRFYIPRAIYAWL